ncbi:hypothetical protein FA048_00640 [Pedobacter polaris]|uniref:Uncharacterized protein n=1 Tax=Pedobacter polaris TaxID=2571273 RepID=A0A4U1CVJ8_9SPHI|nr:hypothetical protein [Pedobacter polaris]TKC12160.1 hypothetical protein FA048_00640 [Pedobacter polaris]
MNKYYYICIGIFPLPLYIMRMFLLIVLISISTYSLAQNPSGCIIVFPYGAVASYPGVYPTALGINVPSGQSADIVGKPAYSNTGGIAVSYSCYKNPNPTSTRQCAVRVPNGGSSYIWYGGVLAQNFYQCPIDDYIPILIVFTAIVGWVVIRKKLTLA